MTAGVAVRRLRDASSHFPHARYVLPRHKAANWVGSGRQRTSTLSGPTALLISQRLGFSTGSSISCRRRGKIGTGVTECSC